MLILVYYLAAVYSSVKKNGLTVVLWYFRLRIKSVCGLYIFIAIALRHCAMEAHSLLSSTERESGREIEREKELCAWLTYFYPANATGNASQYPAAMLIIMHNRNIHLGLYSYSDKSPTSQD